MSLYINNLNLINYTTLLEMGIIYSDDRDKGDGDMVMDYKGYQ